MEYLRLLDIYMRMTLNLTILLFWAATLDPLLIGPLSSIGGTFEFVLYFNFIFVSGSPELPFYSLLYKVCYNFIPLVIKKK